MSRKPNPVPTPAHIHQGNVDVRNSRTRMRQTKRLRQNVTADVVSDEMVSALLGRKSLAELNTTVEAVARVLGTKKKEDGE